MKVYRVLIILLGIFMISMPTAIGVCMKGEQIRPVNENRVSAQWPEGEVTQLITEDGSYGTAIETYYNDKFGLRDLFIRTKNQIRYSVFNMTPGLYIGEDGYLSYESLVSKVQITNEKMTQEQLEEMVVSFENVTNYLEEKGIGFYFLIAPQKNEVFPERTEHFPVHRPTPNNYEKLCSMFKESELLTGHFIDADSILVEAEEYFPTFYKTDFHWNGYGATKVYTEIVNACAAYDGLETVVYSEDDYSVYYGGAFKGGQLNDLPLLVSWEPETEVVVSKNTPGTLLEITDGTEPNGAMARYINTDKNAPLGKVLLIGDSYTWYLIASGSGLLDCFEEVYWVHVGQMENALTNYAELVDYVVLEQVASGPESDLSSLAKGIKKLYSESGN